MPQNVNRPQGRCCPRPSFARLLRWTAILCALALVPCSTAFGDSDPGSPDSKAEAVAERTLEAMGGRDAWEATRFIRFNFFGRRLHHWDKHTGRHRLEGKDGDSGDAYVVLHNVNTREGEVYVNGEAQEGDTKDEWLERAYGAWVNDTYWLLMPYKLRDPGVNLAYDGEEESGGVAYDRLKLTFDSVGLTPGDTYWAWFNRDTGLMDRWAYFLQGWGEDRSRTGWHWLDWQTYGAIKLSSRRKNVDDGNERLMSEVAVFDHLPDEVFTSPELPAAE